MSKPASEALLLRVPVQADLERLYYELAQYGAPSLGRDVDWPYEPETLEELIALAGDMLRYDPRLLSVLLQLFVQSWSEWHLARLRREMRRMRCPQALCVVYAFAQAARLGDQELIFAIDYLQAGWKRIDPTERFFLDGDRPGSRMARRKAGRNLRPYANWGFIATERPTLSAYTKETVGSYDAKTRNFVLEKMVTQAQPFTLSDYLRAIDHAVSRQQALKDLKSHPNLKLVGRGRGARWQPT